MTRKLIAVGILFVLLFSVWSVKAAEPSFELTARYILEVVKAFRTAYVLEVVEQILRWCNPAWIVIISIPKRRAAISDDGMSWADLWCDRSGTL